MTGKIPSTLFSTESLKAKERKDTYRESMGVFFEVDNIDSNGRIFYASIESFLLSEIMLVDCQTMAQNFYRPSKMIAQDGLDHIVIQAFIEGKTTNLKNPDEIVGNTGNLIVIDGARSWEAYNTDFRNISLIIPRRLLKDKLLDESAHHGKVLCPKKNPFAALLRDHISSLHRTIADLTLEHAHSLVSPCVDLVVAALNSSQSSPAMQSVQNNHHLTLFRIKKFIEENITDPTLGLDRILIEFSLTRSSLYRIFPKSEGGVMTYIRERKLKYAYRRLAFPGKHRDSISQIAFESGFENESSFTRAFKSYYKVLPSEVARGAASFELSKAENPDRKWESWLRLL